MTSLTAVRRRPFFGWYIVGASSVAFLFAFGFIYSFSVFGKPISEVIGYDAEAVAVLFSISYTVFQLAGFVTGLVVDKTGPRLLVAIGGLLFGIGLIFASRATTNLQIATAYGLGVGLGLSCIYVPVTDVVGNWFIRSRGYATGLTVAGMGLGNLLIPPIAATMIARYGVRPTLAACGIIALLAIPAMSLPLVPKPEDMDLLPDGDLEPPQDLAAMEGGLSLGDAVRSRDFWCLYASVGFASFGLFLPFAHLAGYASLHGASVQVAALIVSMVGAGVLVSRLVLGRYLDRVAPRALVRASMAVLAVDMAFWFVARSPLPLGLFAIVFGICYATNNSVQPALVLDYFGERHGGALIGLLFSAAIPGSLLGPPLAGQIVDSTHSYNLAIAFATVAFLLATIVMCFLPEPSMRPGAEIN
jgi:MFS family permease